MAERTRRVDGQPLTIGSTYRIRAPGSTHDGELMIAASATELLGLCGRLHSPSEFATVTLDDVSLVSQLLGGEDHG